MEKQDKNDSVILKICKCHRAFDPLTGESDREPMPFIRPDWICSKQPCRVCDREFYIEKAMRIIQRGHDV